LVGTSLAGWRVTPRRRPRTPRARLLVLSLTLSVWACIGDLAALVEGGGPVASAAAEETAAEAKERALRAYKVGLDFYKREEWDKAIEQFDAGYKASPQAVFLFNIAQAHSKAGRPDQALLFYRRYLNEAPNAPNRADVEGRVAALEKQLGPAAALPQLAVPADAPAADAPEPAPAGLVVTKTSGKRKAWPIVLGVLGGVVVVGAAVGLGVYFGTRETSQVTVFEPVMP
jgi:hypothetical protein